MFDEPIELKNQIQMKDAVGRTLVCEDGIPRMVVNICASNRYPYKYCINETDPESELGYFVHILSFVWQITGKGVPDRETIELTNRAWGHMDYRQGEHPLERLKNWKKTPSGILYSN